MTRRSKLTALLCAQSFLLAMALPALADPAPPPPPDGGPDYVFESGPVISHSWDPGSVAGSGIQSSSAMGQAQTFSTGGSGGRGGEQGAQSLVIAHKKADSKHANPTGASTATPPPTNPVAELRTLVQGAAAGFIFTPAGQSGPWWIVVPDSGSGVIFEHGETAVDVQNPNQAYPFGQGTVEVTSFDGDTDSIQGTFEMGSDGGGSFTELTGVAYVHHD